MDGISALDSWDLVIETFHSSSIQAQEDLKRDRQSRIYMNKLTKTRTKQDDLDLVSVDQHFSKRKVFSF